MNLSKIALVLFGGVALLTVGAPIASAAPAYPQTYWTQQAPGYDYGYGCGYYGNSYGCGYYGNRGW